MRLAVAHGIFGAQQGSKVKISEGPDDFGGGKPLIRKHRSGMVAPDPGTIHATISCSVTAAKFARTIAAAIGGGTLLPHMRTCTSLVIGSPSAPRSIW